MYRFNGMAYSLDNILPNPDEYFNNNGYGVWEDVQWYDWGRPKPRGRSRGRGRYRGGRNRGRGRGRFGNGSRANRLEQPIHSDLIESRKVFIANLDKSVTESELIETLSKFAHVEEVKIIRKKVYNPTVYGFATFSSEEDTKKVLSMTREDHQLYKSCRSMVIKPAKRYIKLPGAPGYVRKVADEREFDLEPPNIDEPTAHVLIDDVLLKIFDCLPLRNLISIERVCRRWQSLMYSTFRKRAQLEIETDLDLFLMKNEIPKWQTAVSKVLLLSGEYITKLTIGETCIVNDDSVKLLRIIAQLCPLLESITIKNMNKLDESSSYLFKELVNSCKKLTEFRILGDRSFCDNNFKIIMTGVPNLKVLDITQSKLKGEHMGMLPSSLKELRLINCKSLMTEGTLSKLQQCKNLEVLVLEKLILFGSVLTEIGKNCQKIIELRADVSVEFDKVDLSHFKSLKKLHFQSTNYSVNKLIKDLPQLEELKVLGMISETSKDFVDFSLLKNLKSLIVPSTLRESFSQASLQTITLCSNLEKLNLSFTSNIKEIILSCIRKCPSLKEILCSHICLKSSDISNFVEASKRSAHRIKLVIGLDKSALDEIEKLADAKYDIEIFDTFNLFRDSDDHHFYDDLHDVMDEDFLDDCTDDDDDSIFSDDLDFEEMMDNYAYMHNNFDDFMDPLDLYLLHHEGYYDSDLEGFF